MAFFRLPEQSKVKCNCRKSSVLNFTNIAIHLFCLDKSAFRLGICLSNYFYTLAKNATTQRLVKWFLYSLTFLFFVEINNLLFFVVEQKITKSSTTKEFSHRNI